MTLDELKKLTKAELLELAKQINLRVTSQMMKPELIEIIAVAEKKGKKPLPPKPKAAPQEKNVIPPEERRILAAKKVAQRFIAGVKEKARKPKRSRPAAGARRTAAPAKEVRIAEKAAPVEAREPRPALKEARPAPKEILPVAKEPLTPAKPVRPAAAPAKESRPAPAPRARKVKRERVRAKATPKVSAARKAAEAKAAEESKKASDEAIRQRAEEGKYYLGAEQRVMPPVEAIEIPKGYRVDRIAAMVRDPYWLFTYWEVTDHKYRELERTFGNVWPRCKMILRVYDRTAGGDAHFDIHLSPDARNWYVSVTAERRYQIAIGALSPDGRFELVAISNVVETPSGRVSDRVDEHWMVPDEVFNRIFAASGGHDMHSASGELKGLIEKRLLEELSSGAVTSFGSGALYKEAKGRAFRLWVATELILYGGTEPDARVTVQGKEVKLRPDGTFSLRFALPDGKIDLPVTAVSADKIEERTIETDVTKKSRKKEPVLK